MTGDVYILVIEVYTGTVLVCKFFNEQQWMYNNTLIAFLVS